MQKIQFNRERDFSAVFSDTFLFLKQNFKTFAGSVVLIAGPFLLVCGFTMGYMQSGIMGFARAAMSGFNFSDLYVSMSVAFFFAFVGQAVLNSVVYNYMLLYNEKPFGETITIGEVAKRVLSSTPRLLGGLLLLVLIMMIIGAFITFVFIGIGSALGVVGGVISVLLVVIGMLIYFPVLAYQFPASLFVVTRDRVAVLEGWSKVFRYIRGNFWWTWLVMLVAVISLYIINLIFTLPATILTLAGTFTRMQNYGEDAGAGGHSMTIIILYTFATFMSYSLSSVYLVLTTFHFLGQEEKSEGAGLFSKIEDIK